MNQLPALPRVGTAITLPDVQAVEAQVANAVTAITDLETLEEWQARAAALAQYLKGKELHGPMLGAQRRVEARIGQLLGEAINGSHNSLPSHVREGARELSATDRQRFRILARGLERGLADEEWRSGREALIKLIQQRYPMPRHVPTVTTKEGSVKKPFEERKQEIEKLAAEGYRAGQIASKLGIVEEQVRKIARRANISLVDDDIGRARKLDAKRILTETINGVDAYISGLPMLYEVGLPSLDEQEKHDLLQALSRSINGLRKLRIKMEAEYAGSHSTAA